MMVRFDSIDRYIAEVTRLNAATADNDGWNDRSWDMGIKGLQACKLATEGDSSLVQRAEQIVDKHLATHLATGLGPAWAPSPAGSRVSIPGYLGGSPNTMLRRVKAERQVNTLSIYVSTTCSAGCNAEKMLYRGCVILAFLSYIQAMQISVDLYLLAETHGRTDGDLFQVIQVESRPLDLSTASFAISHPAFARHVTYGYAKVKDGFNGSWPSTYSKYGGMFGRPSPEYEDHLRAVLNMQPRDVYIPAANIGDKLLTDPEAWLSERISQL